jgi:Type of WD40 repeat
VWSVLCVQSEMFQSDIYPPTASAEPALSAAQWLSGLNREPRLVSLQVRHSANSSLLFTCTALLCVIGLCPPLLLCRVLFHIQDGTISQPAKELPASNVKVCRYLLTNFSGIFFGALVFVAW